MDFGFVTLVAGKQVIFKVKCVDKLMINVRSKFQVATDLLHLIIEHCFVAMKQEDNMGIYLAQFLLLYIL